VLLLYFSVKNKKLQYIEIDMMQSGHLDRSKNNPIKIYFDLKKLGQHFFLKKRLKQIYFRSTQVN